MKPKKKPHTATTASLIHAAVPVHFPEHKIKYCTLILRTEKIKQAYRFQGHICSNTPCALLFFFFFYFRGRREESVIESKVQGLTNLSRTAARRGAAAAHTLQANSAPSSSTAQPCCAQVGTPSTCFWKDPSLLPTVPPELSSLPAFADGSYELIFPLPLPRLKHCPKLTTQLVLLS